MTQITPGSDMGSTFLGVCLSNPNDPSIYQTQGNGRLSGAPRPEQLWRGAFERTRARSLTRGCPRGYYGQTNARVWVLDTKTRAVLFPGTNLGGGTNQLATQAKSPDFAGQRIAHPPIPLCRRVITARVRREAAIYFFCRSRTKLTSSLTWSAVTPLA